MHSCKSFLFPITEKWNFRVLGSNHTSGPSANLKGLPQGYQSRHSDGWVIFRSHCAWSLSSFQLSFSFPGCSAWVSIVQSADIAHIPMVAPSWSIFPAPPNPLYLCLSTQSSLESFLSPFFFHSLPIITLGERIHFYDFKCQLFVLDTDFLVLSFPLWTPVVWLTAQMTQSLLKFSVFEVNVWIFLHIS